MSTIEKDVTRVTTGKVRLSFFKGWKPEATDDSRPEDKYYSTAIIISKDDKDTIAKINAAVEHLEKEYKAKNKGKLPAKWKRPLRDGDEEKPDDSNYENSFFLNCKSKNKPAIVGRERDENGKLKPITDESEVYSGCYARLGINFYQFDTKGNLGIGVGLNSVQKLADGPKLAGGSNPEADFEEEFEDDFLD